MDHEPGGTACGEDAVIATPEGTVRADRSPEEIRASLQRNRWSGRSLGSALWSVVFGTMAFLAAAPLFAVLYLLVVKGAWDFRLSMLWELPPTFVTPSGEGGFGNAIVGTLLMVGIASAIAIPVGIAAAVFLAEFGPTTRLAGVIRFAAKTLTGMPSILAGVFAYAFVVLTTGSFSAYAGGVALSILMVPVVVLTAEQALLAVPAKMKMAAVGMGATPTQVSLRVTLPTALPSVLTGVLLAVARAAGETAPLLFTAQWSTYYPRGDRLENTASLAVLIYEFTSKSNAPNQRSMAWTAALMLVVLVLAFNLVGRWLARRNELSRG